MSLMWLLIYYSIIVLLLLSYKMSTRQIPIENSTHRLDVYEICAVFAIISLSILCATRDINSYDSKNYSEYFYRFKSINFFLIEGSYRIGFEYLSKTLAWLTNYNYKLIFGIIAFFNTLVVYYVTNKNKNLKIYGFITYLSFLGIYYNCIVLRQGLAISFIILAYSNFKNSRIKFIIYTILAVLFHESAIIVLIIFLIINKDIRINKKACYILLTIFIFLYVSKITNLLIEPVFTAINNILPQDIFYKYIIYVKDINLIEEVSIFYLCCFVLTLWLVYKSTLKSSTYNALLVFNIIGLGFLSLFSGTSTIIRITDYLTATTYIFLVPEAFANEEYKDVFIGVIFSGLTFFYVRMVLNLVTFY